MQKVVGSNPISRFTEPGSEPGFRLRTAARLLPQPYSFEGFGVAEEPLFPNDLPVLVEGRNGGQALGDRRAAGLPACSHLQEHDEPVSKIDQLPGLVPKLGPVAEPVALERVEALVAAIGRLK